MRSRNEHNGQEVDPYTELSLLSEVDRTPDTTQRGLARTLGISLGLTNLLLRNVAHKGYLRVVQANWRRRLYALTPKGMIRRVLLTSAYVNRILGHYQRVKLILQEELDPLALHAESRVAIYGTEEFAELVYLGLRNLGIEEVDIFAPQFQEGRMFLGMPVRDVASLHPGSYDRVLISTFDSVEIRCAELRAQGVSTDKLVTFFKAKPLEVKEKETSNAAENRKEQQIVS